MAALPAAAAIAMLDKLEAVVAERACCPRDIAQRAIALEAKPRAIRMRQRLARDAVGTKDHRATHIHPQSRSTHDIKPRAVSLVLGAGAMRNFCPVIISNGTAASSGPPCEPADWHAVNILGGRMNIEVAIDGTWLLWASAIGIETKP